MPRGSDWSRLEVDACVADYLRMLTLELNGQRFSKTEHANALMQKLDQRTRPSIEFKHCNISAVMIELGFPYVKGYKPRSNYQSILVDVLEAHLPGHPQLHEAAQVAALRPATPVVVESFDAVWVPAPRPMRVRETPPSYSPRFSAVRRDYLAQESRNHSLGRAGEILVVDLEARRLHAAGKKVLAERVEHVAATQGDGLGYDVLSFEINGRERLVEVKTTAFGEFTPFFVSRNELARSVADAAQYRLYRLYDFRNAPKLFELPGALSTHCQLDAVSYLAHIAG